MDWKSYKRPLLFLLPTVLAPSLKIAFMANRHNTIGIDLVAMSILTTSLFMAQSRCSFSGLPCGKQIERGDRGSSIVDGIVEGCKQSNCALVGGETAEMPPYQGEEYDCAGFVVGVVDGEKLIDGTKLQEGDAIIALASSGIRS